MVNMTAVPGHSNILHVTGAPGTMTAGTSDILAWRPMACTGCERTSNAAVIALVHGEGPPVTWLRCPVCGHGMVDNAGAVSPPALLGESVDGLPQDVADAYNEARQTAGVNAFTSCELICRKILMHVAADKGAAEGLSFVAYLDFLKDTGYITPPMMPWVDLIRSHGNQSTHRLHPASRERALNTLAFTTQLLRLVYEMEHRAQQFVTPGNP
jgi:hypothetical protein